MTETAIPTAPPASMRNSPGAAPFPNPVPRTEIIYPDSDGKPMADNTRQFRYIVTIQGGIAALFADNPNVFVAGDLLWYPVEATTRFGPRPTRWWCSVARPATGAPTCNGGKTTCPRRSCSR